MHLLPDLKPLISWLHHHPAWSGIVALFISFTESTAFIGVVIPGTVIMTALGTLIGAGVLEAKIIFPWAIVGAIAGDAISFWIGRHFKGRLRHTWPLTRFPNMLHKGEDFFKKHGGKSIFLGRFAGPTRAMIPMVGGMMNFPTKRFIFADVFSAICWAPVYMLPGILIGAASVELAPDTATRLILIILAWLLGLWLVGWLIKLCLGYVLRTMNLILDKSWQTMRNHKTLHPFTIALQNPSNPDGHGQLTLGILTLIAGLLFVCLACNVALHGGITDWNAPIYHLFRSFRSPTLDSIMVGITFLGDVPVILTTLFFVFAWLAYRSRWWAALHCLGNGILAAGCVFTIKKLFQYPRPPGVAVIRNTASFPSAHVTLLVMLFGFLATLIASELPKEKRHWVYLPVILLVLLIGSTRLYLGAHWFTDILGGFLLGTACVMLTSLSYRRRKVDKIAVHGLLITTLLGVVIGLTTFFYFEYSKQLHNYTPTWPAINLSKTSWWQQTKPVLPLYQHNRLGHATGIYNIQWYGTLDTLTQSLAGHSWKKEPKRDVVSIINRIAAKDTEPKLPFLPQLMRGQIPTVVFTQPAGTEQLLVLRLWPIHPSLAPNEKQFYIGSLLYRIPRHHWLIHHPIPKMIAQNNLLTKLAAVQSQFRHRTVNYESKTNLFANPGQQRADILLIQNN